MKIGGGSRTRTGDIRLAKPTLYLAELCPRFPSAREAGSGSVSFRARSSVLVSFFWEAAEASFPRHVSPGPSPDRLRSGAEQTN